MSEPREPEPDDPRDPRAESDPRAAGASGGSPPADGTESGHGSPDGDGSPDGHGSSDGHGARGVRRPPAGLLGAWRTFRHTPFFPATVLALIVAAAAGLFAGSYTYAMANPTPRTIPAAVVESPGGEQTVRAFGQGMEQALRSSLKVHRYRTFAEAKEAVDNQKVFAVLRVTRPGSVELNLSGAAGASVAELLQQAAPKVGKKAGVSVTVKDLKPLGKGDPRGLTIFYMTLAADVIGFIGAIQLTLNVPDLSRIARLCFIAAYALIGGFVIAAVVGWLLNAVHLPFVHSWMILALTMFTSGMVFAMFYSLIGRWAMIPTWLVMVLLGNPSSGGAVSWPLLPSALGAVGRWLPPGASVNAQHTAVYFAGNEHVMPYLVLAAWAVVGAALFLLLGARQEKEEEE